MSTGLSDFGSGAGREWFARDRFGLFIHWGLYSLAARHEWVRHRERISDEEYARYFDHFYPDLYDPAVWAQEAKNAGMRYVVITSKHHDGFCLWDSALTDFKAPRTPWGKDVLRPMVDAFRAQSFKIGFYHSLLDWHHPHFPLDALHPLRDDLAYREAHQARDIRIYAEYLHEQTRELLTDFGKIDIMWYDFSYSRRRYPWGRGKGKDDWQSEKLLAMVRALQPGILVNDRLELEGDFRTPEEYQPRESLLGRDGERAVWEACQTLNGSWGYFRDNLDWREPAELIRTLIDTVSKGGNLLLNVGPNARGEFEPRALDRLRAIGAWMRLHGRSIYGCTAADADPALAGLRPPSDCRYTYDPAARRLYVHIFVWPLKHLHLDGLAGRVAYAQLLNDASEIKMRVIDPNQVGETTTPAGGRADTLTLELPVQRPDVAVPVVELFLSGS
jgi:alpha-L-fucosidase